jgi:hypothetical protein
VMMRAVGRVVETSGSLPQVQSARTPPDSDNQQNRNAVHTWSVHLYSTLHPVSRGPDDVRLHVCVCVCVCVFVRVFCFCFWSKPSSSKAGGVN